MIRLYLATDEAHTFTASFFAVESALDWGRSSRQKNLCVHRGERERVRAREWWLRWPNTQKGTFRVFRGDTDRLVAVWMDRRRR